MTLCSAGRVSSAHLPHLRDLGQHDLACEGSLHLATESPATRDCLQPDMLFVLTCMILVQHALGNHRLACKLLTDTVQGGATVPAHRLTILHLGQCIAPLLQGGAWDRLVRRPNRKHTGGEGRQVGIQVTPSCKPRKSICLPLQDTELLALTAGLRSTCSRRGTNPCAPLPEGLCPIPSLALSLPWRWTEHLLGWLLAGGLPVCGASVSNNPVLGLRRPSCQTARSEVGYCFKGLHGRQD